MTDQTTNPFATVAASFASDTVAFIDASRKGDAAATPFARSSLAAIVGGLSSLAMAQTVLLASFGAPKSPATGKPIKNASGLRNLDGGLKVYQAWKDITFLVENIDADKETVIEREGEEPVTVGDGAIRKAIVSFILNEGDVRSLFGAKGITATVKRLMADHAEAIASAMGVEPDADDDNGEGASTVTAPQSLTERATALLVALQAASDEAFLEAQAALAAVSDHIITVWERLESETGEQPEQQPEQQQEAAAA